MAKVIVYSRVSTSEQEMHGSSLGDQGERIEQWLRENGHEKLAAYSEHGSGGSAKKRKEFSRMMEEVELLRPDILLVDSADRFTRSSMDGGKYASHLTDLGVRLAVIEHDDGRVLDMEEHSDRAWVMQAFMIADAERARMSARQRKRYAEQRRRGATTTNRPGFGLRRAGDHKGRRHLEVDPETAPIVAEMDARALKGQSQRTILTWLKEFEGAPRSGRGLTLALRNPKYVACGVRSIETQQKLNALHEETTRRAFGPERAVHARKSLTDVRSHQFSKMIACGLCVAAGYAPTEARMIGRHINANPNPYNLVCEGGRGRGAAKVRIHTPTMIGVHKLLPLLIRKLDKLRDRRVAEAVIARWIQEPATDSAARLRASLGTAIGKCDADEAAIDARVNAAIQLMTNGAPGVADEAARILGRANADRLAVAAKRAALTQKLSDLPAPRRREVDVDDLYWEADAMFTDLDADVHTAMKKWVDAIGPPIWYGRRERKQGRRLDNLIDLRWPFLDDVRPEDAPSYNQLVDSTIA